MSDTDMHDGMREALNSIKSWLASRPSPATEDKAIISAPDGLRSIGFADLILAKAGPENQESVISCYDYGTQKLKNWVETSHLLAWTSELVTNMTNNKMSLATLDLLRGAKEFPISLAKHHVDECIAIIQSAQNFELGLDIEHPETKGQNYAVTNIMIDDTVAIHDLVLQVFTNLYAHCAVRLIIKSNLYYSSAMATYLVDLMHQSGATGSEIDCVAFDRRESVGSEKFSKCISNKNSKLSTVSIVFKHTDTFAAAQGIIESYFRELYPNTIVLVEEAAYERFVKDWQRYYSNALQIGPRVDGRTIVVDSFNSKVQIDLEAIDIKASHKMPGHVVNVLRFRTLTELLTLLSNLRKIPFISVWNDDILLTREFCLRLNQCNEFWVNHLPKSLAQRRYCEEMLHLYYDSFCNEMTGIYNSIVSQFGDDVEQLKKVYATFMKKDAFTRSSLLLKTYTSMISKNKSLKNGISVNGAISRLKRFQQNLVQQTKIAYHGNSFIETMLKPVGMAMYYIREENVIKSKPLMLELIFKNLLLGNAVLFVCPPSTLGARFSFENDHVIPFKMLNEVLPDMSRLSLEDFEVGATSKLVKQCPKGVHAIEIVPDMSHETLEAITVAFGSRPKSIWYPDVEQINYWSNES